MNHDDVKRRLLQIPGVQEAYDNPPLELKVARAVVECRRARGRSQKELAQMLGTSQNQIYRIESGNASLNMKMLGKLQSVVGLHFDSSQESD